MTVIDGQLDIFDLLSPEPVAEWSGELALPATPGDVGTFHDPGHPEAIYDAQQAWRSKYSVENGNFRFYRGWATYSESSGAESSHHTLLFNAGLSCHHFVGDECSCVNWYLSRIYCDGCNWWSGIHGSGKKAVHEYLDHCWPGWRDLPVIESKMKGYSYAYDFPADYPEAWKIAGAPMLDCRGNTKTGTRDVPGANPFGGYKVAVIQDCKQHNQKGEK